MIALRHISFSYGKEALMQDFSFHLRKGEVHSLIGPNGCGKSTALKLAAGLLKPKSGQILLQGKAIETYKRRELAKKISLLHQARVVSSVSALEVVLAGRYPHRRGVGLFYTPTDQQAARHAMELTHCSHLAQRPINRLSGGERQRVFLAAALAQDTGVILLDEPTTYLDTGTAMDFMELIAQIGKTQEKTIGVVLHDLELALRYSNRVTVIKAGKVLVSGDVQRVLEGGAIPQAFGVDATCFEKEGERYYCFRNRSFLGAEKQV